MIRIVALTDSNSSNGSVNLTDATPIYDDIMEIKPDKIPEDQIPKAQTIALQSLVDNLETNDLKSIFKNESETFLKGIDLTQPLDGIIKALQEKQRSSYGIPHLVATQLLRQLQQQGQNVEGSPIKVLSRSLTWENAKSNPAPGIRIVGIMDQDTINKKQLRIW